MLKAAKAGLKKALRRIRAVVKPLRDPQQKGKRRPSPPADTGYTDARGAKPSSNSVGIRGSPLAPDDVLADGGLLYDPPINLPSSSAGQPLGDSAVLQSLRILEKEFPLMNSDWHALDVYGNILDICRPGCRNLAIRKQALSLILTQIQRGDSTTLASAISSEGEQCIQFLISDILACLPTTWMEASREDHHVDLQHYFEYQPSQTGPHPLATFLPFLLSLSQQNTPSSQALFDAGYLNLVVCLCKTEFRTPSKLYDVGNLLQVALSTLSTLVSKSVIRATLSSRWALLRQVWPSEHLAAFDDSTFTSVIHQYQQQEHTFSLDVDFGGLSLRRQASLHASVTGSLDHDHTGSFSEACLELLEIARDSPSDAEVMSIVVDIFSDIFASEAFRTRRQGWTQLRTRVMECQYNVIVQLFFALINRYLLGMNHSGLQTHASQIPQIGRLVHTFLDFAEFATESSACLRTAFVEAGIQELQPFREGDYWLRFEYNVPVARILRDRAVRQLDEEKAEVLTLVSQGIAVV